VVLDFGFDLALGLALDQLSQDDPDLLLHRAAVTGRTQAEIGFDGLVELSDGQAGHDGSPAAMIAMLSFI
jgi:hypothetical protein